jgi:hypothetical protein
VVIFEKVWCFGRDGDGEAQAGNATTFTTAWISLRPGPAWRCAGYFPWLSAE